jgi:hypothetical protein
MSSYSPVTGFWWFLALQSRSGRSAIRGGPVRTGAGLPLMIERIAFVPIWAGQSKPQTLLIAIQLRSSDGIDTMPDVLRRRENDPDGLFVVCPGSSGCPAWPSYHEPDGRE